MGKRRTGTAAAAFTTIQDSLAEGNEKIILTLLPLAFLWVLVKLLSPAAREFGEMGGDRWTRHLDDVGSWCVRLLLDRRDVGPDVDAPARQAGREASVLPLATDGEAELVVRDDDPRRLGSRVDDLDARHARR